MRWSDVRAAYPDQWLVIEALEAHTSGNRRILDRIGVIDVCPDGRATMKRYRELHRMHPQREICFAHTGMVELDIEERPWLGARGVSLLQSAPSSSRIPRQHGT